MGTFGSRKTHVVGSRHQFVTPWWICLTFILCTAQVGSNKVQVLQHSMIQHVGHVIKCYLSTKYFCAAWHKVCLLAKGTVAVYITLIGDGKRKPDKKARREDVFKGKDAVIFDKLDI